MLVNWSGLLTVDLFSRKLSTLWLLDLFDQRAILAYIVLFEHDSILKLKKPSDLEDIVIMNTVMFQNYAERLDDKFDFQNFLNTISKMSVFCSNHLDCKGDWR